MLVAAKYIQIRETVTITATIYKEENIYQHWYDKMGVRKDFFISRCDHYHFLHAFFPLTT